MTAWVGGVTSTRMVVVAVRTGSTLPTSSTEKYRIVNVPDVARSTDAPCDELVVGVEPSVVK